MKIALVGAGAIAQSWLEAIRTTGRAELVAVADAVRPTAEAAAEPFGAAVFDDAAALLDATSPELLIVSTPPVTHADIAVDALGRDVSVLCEKPLSVSIDAAEEMIAAADASAGILSMASKFRFVDAVIRAKSMVSSGSLGDIVWMRNTFSAPVDMSGRWNSNPGISGGGVVIDNGTHSVDLARYLIGPITSVLAVEGPRPEGLAVEDTVQLLLRSHAGTVVTVNLSWSLQSTGACFVELDGTKGHACLGWAGSKFTTSSSPGWDDFSQAYDKHDAFRRNLVNVLDAVENGTDPLVGPTEALASVRVIEAAYASLRGGAWVDV